MNVIANYPVKFNQYKCNNYQNNYYNDKFANKTTFKAHPDFDAISQVCNITVSGYFRRGGFYGLPNQEFVDIIKVFNKFFGKDMQNKVKMLIGGIGNSQEPFSYLAVIKNLIGNRKISDVVELYIVDLQSRPDKKTLMQQSFYDHPGEPFYVRDSFVKDNSEKYNLPLYRKYRVNDEIRSYLETVYNDNEKSRWETRLQEAMFGYSTGAFDIISINNTLMYINDNSAKDSTIKNAVRTLKPKGVFITDPHLDYSNALNKNVDEIAKGIYQKKTKPGISSFMDFPFVEVRPLDICK